MKVLLTGASGFIGSHVAKELVRDGCQVTAIMQPGTDAWRFQDIESQIRQIECDLTEYDQVTEILDQHAFDLCIHPAWYAVPGKYPHSNENMASMGATVHLFFRLSERGCKRFVGIGSCFEYDHTLGTLSEDSAMDPKTLYEVCKLATKGGLEEVAKSSPTEFAWVRLFYQYGPYEDERRLVPWIICSLLRNERAKSTKGEQVRDFMHVEDVASSIWAVAKSNLTGAVNSGCGKPVAIADIVTTIGQLLDRSDLLDIGAMPYREGETMLVASDNRKLVEGTGWRPKYDLRSGLEHTIAWWRKHLNL